MVAMEFHEKLQELRKQKGMTQEELAAALYVSRTAVSKWESGRGYPNIESLKGLAAFFSVTIDQLLSGDQILTIAEEEQKRKDNQLRQLVFGLLDCGAAMLVFLPFFCQTQDGKVAAVSLLSLHTQTAGVKWAYWAVIAAMVVCGVVGLFLRGRKSGRREGGSACSILLNGAGMLLFILSRQPYAATFLLLFLLIKELLRTKKG